MDKVFLVLFLWIIMSWFIPNYSVAIWIPPNIRDTYAHVYEEKYIRVCMREGLTDECPVSYYIFIKQRSSTLRKCSPKLVGDLGNTNHLLTLSKMRFNLPEPQSRCIVEEGAANLQVCATSWDGKWRDVACPLREGPMKMNIVQHHSILTPPPSRFSSFLAQLFYIKSMVVQLCTQIATRQLNRWGETDERDDHAVCSVTGLMPSTWAKFTHQ